MAVSSDIQFARAAPRQIGLIRILFEGKGRRQMQHRTDRIEIWSAGEYAFRGEPLPLGIALRQFAMGRRVLRLARVRYVK